VTLLSGHAYRAPEMQSAGVHLSAATSGNVPVIR